MVKRSRQVVVGARDSRVGLLDQVDEGVVDLCQDRAVVRDLGRALVFDHEQLQTLGGVEHLFLGLAEGFIAFV